MGRRKRPEDPGSSQKRKTNPIPEFATEDEEREFWATHDTTHYFDWSKARGVVFFELKPSTRPISLRLPETPLMDLKRLAHEQDVPYQSLMKVYLAERVAAERRARRRRATRPGRTRS